jgi:glycosyltransferase involved in cell wall biosynthesis
VKHIQLKAPCLTSSGYGVHARQVVRALFSYVDDNVATLSVVPTQWGNTPWLLRDDMCDGLVGRIKKHCNSDRHPDMSVQLLLPNEWTPIEGAVNIGMTAAVETDRLNPLWIDSVNAMDNVIVPSAHVMKTLTSSGTITKPMHVVPEAFIDAVTVVDQHKAFEFETKFNFLVVAQLTSDRPHLDRKNVLNTIRVITETFRNDPDVGIVVKVNSGRSTLIDRKVTIDRIRQLLKQVRRGASPRIYVVHGDLSDVEMASLYRHPTIKAFVTLTRGEGFGLPILEAAASGLPVIATNWSGHLDFLDRGRFVKVNYCLEKIPTERVDHHSQQSRNIWIDGAMWAQPREQNAVQALKKFRMSPDIPRQWASNLASTLLKEFSSDAVTLQYRRIFDDVLL